MSQGRASSTSRPPNNRTHPCRLPLEKVLGLCPGPPTFPVSMPLATFSLWAGVGTRSHVGRSGSSPMTCESRDRRLRHLQSPVQPRPVIGLRTPSSRLLPGSWVATRGRRTHGGYIFLSTHPAYTGLTPGDEGVGARVPTCFWHYLGWTRGLGRPDLIGGIRTY